MAKKDFNKVSGTFCILPFLHLATRTDGAFVACCVAWGPVTNGRDVPIRWGYSSYKTAFNSEYMKDIRRRMLEGKQVEACRRCYHEEENGVWSARMGANEFWQQAAGAEARSRVAEAEANDGRVKSDPMFLDLRQGNLCNLKCRSCVPENSRQIHREYQELARESRWFHEAIHPGIVAPQTEDWYEKKRYLSEFRKLLPSLRKIYFTGGEPTLIEENYALLEECVREGYAKDIALQFNTNGTNLQQRFLDVLRHFKEVYLHLSVDSVGAQQEYLRHGSRWTTIDRNLRALLERTGPNTALILAPVFQFANALGFTKLLRYVDQLNRESESGQSIEVTPYALLTPEYLDSIYLPPSAKEAALLELFEYRGESDRESAFTRLYLPSLEGKLRTPQPEDTPLQYQRFIGFTQTLDRVRGQSFFDIFPELGAHLRDDPWFMDLWKRLSEKPV